MAYDINHPWQNAGALLYVFLLVFLKFFRKQILCPPQMLHAWQNESPFAKHDHVSNVAVTICPRFSGALPDRINSTTNARAILQAARMYTIFHCPRNTSFTSVACHHCSMTVMTGPYSGKSPSHIAKCPTAKDDEARERIPHNLLGSVPTFVPFNVFQACAAKGN